MKKIVLIRAINLRLVKAAAGPSTPFAANCAANSAQDDNFVDGKWREKK